MPYFLTLFLLIIDIHYFAAAKLLIFFQICAELSWNIILEISNIVEKTKCLILIKQTKDARITDKAQGIDVFYMGI
jgi:hypothetical protein